MTAEDASLDAFLAVSAGSQYQEQLRAYADSLVQGGTTKPSWCVVGFDGDAPVARAALWSMPGETAPTDLVLIEADWHDPELAAGRALLEHLHGLAAELGGDALRHHVDDPPGPPQYQEHDAERIRLLTESGYGLLRDGLRWQYTAPGASEPSATPLTFRNLPEVGDDAFVETIAATYEGTRDSWLTRNIAEHGLLDAARADFHDYRQLVHRPEWWELGFTQDGQRAGVIMAGRTLGPR